MEVRTQAYHWSM